MYQHSQEYHFDVVAYVDRYLMEESHRKQNLKVDPLREAQYIKMLVGVLGQDNRLVAFVNQDDEEGMVAYGGEGYNIRTMNGDRPRELWQLITQETTQQSKSPPKHVVVVSDDPAFELLCEIASRTDAKISVWGIDGHLPAQLSKYQHRHLSELMHPSLIKIREDNVVVRIDLENILVTLAKTGVETTTELLIGAIRKEIEELGNQTSTVAYADYDVLAKDFGRSLQRELEQMDVRTRYQISKFGKNSADIAIVSDIHTELERNPNFQTIVIVTGDRDFRPVVEAAHSYRKKVVVVALRSSLSQDLARIADDVRYLDGYFEPEEGTEVSPDVTPAGFMVKELMQMAFVMHHNKWRHYAPKHSLTHFASDETLRKAVEEGLLRSGHSGQRETLSFSQGNHKARAISYFVPWVVNRIDYLINTKEMPWCDTNYLARGMEMDQGMQKLGIGRSRRNAEEWLEAAAVAKTILKKSKLHPKVPTKSIDTWWPVEDATKKQLLGDRDPDRLEKSVDSKNSTEHQTKPQSESRVKQDPPATHDTLEDLENPQTGKGGDESKEDSQKGIRRKDGDQGDLPRGF